MLACQASTWLPLEVRHPGETHGGREEVRLQDGVELVDDIPHADVGGALRRRAEGPPELAAHLLPVGLPAWRPERVMEQE